MTGSERKARKVERRRADALAHIDDSLGTGRWDQDVFGEVFEANVEQVVQDVAGSVTRSALWAVFTGRGDVLDARADKFEVDMDAKIATPPARPARPPHIPSPRPPPP